MGDMSEAKKIEEGFRRLGEVDSGRPIADAIRKHGTKVHFGSLGPDTVAQFDRQTDEQCDDVAAIMALGEDEAKDLIRLMYQKGNSPASQVVIRC